MTSEISPLFFALGATLCFAYASNIFTEFARRVSSFWMNGIKAFVALFAFWITVFLFRNWVTPQFHSVLAFLGSGCIGLMIGDIFLLNAMRELGPSRILMIFGLQAFILGLASYALLHQSFSWMSFLGVLMMLCCLYTISLESYKKNGHWQMRGMLLGLAGVFLDAIGVLMTRYGFDASPGVSSAQANAIRCVGAVAAFFVINTFYYKGTDKAVFGPVLRSLTTREKVRLGLAAFGGTFLSLMLYLTAISKGQLSVVSSVSVTGPMFAGFFECLRARKLPSPYLFVAFLFFFGGFWIFSNL